MQIRAEKDPNQTHNDRYHLNEQETCIGSSLWTRILFLFFLFSSCDREKSAPVDRNVQRSVAVCVLKRIEFLQWFQPSL